MAALIDGRDWSATPLGPRHAWPQSLQTALRILVTSRYAMWLGWGRELTFFYNDAYAAMTLGREASLGARPAAHRRSGRRSGRISARAPRRVMRTGQATWDEGLLLFLERNGYPEETYHTFSYSPLPDDEGAVGGMLCVVTEDTERVIGERRLATLRELAAACWPRCARSPRCWQPSNAGSRRTSATCRSRIAWLFEPDGKRARLACATGIAARASDGAGGDRPGRRAA